MCNLWRRDIMVDDGLGVNEHVKLHKRVLSNKVRPTFMSSQTIVQHYVGIIDLPIALLLSRKTP